MSFSFPARRARPVAAAIDSSSIPRASRYPVEGFARQVFGRLRFGGVGGSGRFEHQRQPELQCEARVVVRREGYERAQRREDALARARVALAGVRELAAEHRLEGSRIGGVEVEDPRVRGGGIAGRELPFFQGDELPERAEAGAHVFQSVALRDERARERGRPLARPPADGLQRAQRRDVVRLRDEDALEERSRSRRLLADLDQQRRQVERHGALDLRRRGSLDPLRKERRKLGEVAALPLPGASSCRHAGEPRRNQPGRGGRLVDCSSVRARIALASSPVQSSSISAARTRCRARSSGVWAWLASRSSAVRKAR